MTPGAAPTGPPDPLTPLMLPALPLVWGTLEASHGPSWPLMCLSSAATSRVNRTFPLGIQVARGQQYVSKVACDRMRRYYVFGQTSYGTVLQYRFIPIALHPRTIIESTFLAQERLIEHKANSLWLGAYSITHLSYKPSGAVMIAIPQEVRNELRRIDGNMQEAELDSDLYKSYEAQREVLLLLAFRPARKFVCTLLHVHCQRAGKKGMLLLKGLAEK